MISISLFDSQQTLTQWHIVFYIAMSIMVATYLVFLIFGSVEEQPWNKPPAPKESPSAITVQESVSGVLDNNQPHVNK
jgi:hypothetical protein